jgi:flagellar basal-body rod modification protein FlgD
MLQEMQDVAAQSASLLSSSIAFGATNLIGKNVSYTGADGSVANGTVTGVSYGTDGPVLSVGDTDVQLGSILSVATPATA